MANPCVFLDRDGVINIERGDYTYRLEDFELYPGVPEAIAQLRRGGFNVIVITNQAGISKGIYTADHVMACHEKLRSFVEVDALYYSPYHPDQTESLGRKPGSLLFEKAIARYNINPAQSWMVGDRERDLVPARKLGIATVLIDQTGEDSPFADYVQADLLSAVKEVIMAS